MLLSIVVPLGGPRPAFKLKSGTEPAIRRRADKARDIAAVGDYLVAASGVGSSPSR